jgi:hypothetical protein
MKHFLSDQIIIHYSILLRNYSTEKKTPQVPQLGWMAPEARRSVGLVLLQQALDNAKSPAKIRTILKSYAQQGIIANEGIYKKLVQYCIKNSAFETVCWMRFHSPVSFTLIITMNANQFIFVLYCV